MLAQVGSGGEGRIPEWQLTHPYPENREADIRTRIAEDGLPRDGTVNRDAYLNRIDGLVYGADPRQGFFQGTRFLHPELEFELTFPTGWRTVNQRSVVGGVAPGQDGILVLELADDATAPTEALRVFLAQEGIQGGTIRQDGSGAVERARATFQLTTQEGTLNGEAAFVRYGGNVYRLLGYAPTASWNSYAGAVATSISTFRPVTDPAILGVQPMRLDIVTLPGAMSLSSYVAQNPGPVDAEELGRLNRQSPGAVLSSGTRIKRIVGEPLPQ
jgi:predicted Zn-dependent protease